MGDKRPDPVVPPPPKIPLIIKVVDGFNRPLPGAEVVVDTKGKKTTDKRGLANFGPVDPRTKFHITVRKDSFGPPGTPFKPGDNVVDRRARKNGTIDVPLTMNAARLLVTVELPDGAALEGASVGIDGVTGTPMPKTTASGGIGARIIPANMLGVPIRVHAEKPEFGPDPKGGAAFQSDTLAEDTVTLVADDSKSVTLVLTTLQYHMHVDADRDGTVDSDRTGFDKWEFGKGKKGAIVLCNTDDDGGRSDADNTDDAVNGGNDNDELAPIVIRKAGTLDAPPDWEAFLEVSAADANRIRLFDSRATGAKEVIGPAKGASFKFADLKFTEKELGIEALMYADNSFSGEVTITFKIKKGGVEKVTEKAVFRVAPWIMPNHLDAAEKVFVTDFAVNRPAGTGDNSAFRAHLGTFASGAGCTVTTHTVHDQWMQDCMEFGFSSLPTRGFRSVTRAQRPRPLKTFPKTLLAADLGYHEHGDPASMIPGVNPATNLPNPGSKESTFNSTGNLEATPPTKSKAGKNYPFGRIYFGPGRRGEEMDAKVEAFLTKQVVQEPIKVDTNWLSVGHVDEYISFVAASGGKGFKLLLASPKRAFDILNANTAAHGSDKMLVGRQFPILDAAGFVHGWRAAEVSIRAFLTTGIPTLAFNARRAANVTAAALKTFNDAAQSTINTERAKLESAIGVTAADIIDVPILYLPNDVSLAQADALTGGMVNMLVVNKHCLIPKPFGPVVGGKDLFEEDLKTKLAPLGLTLDFIDDWFEYHVSLGEVHCGTNTLRAPTQAKWWEFIP
jgi:protein-arginine deiminase